MTDPNQFLPPGMPVITLDPKKDQEEQINELMMQSAKQDMMDVDYVQGLVKYAMNTPLEILPDNVINEMRFWFYCKQYLENNAKESKSFQPMRDKDGNILTEFDDVAKYYNVPLEKAKQIANGAENLHYLYHNDNHKLND